MSSIRNLKYSLAGVLCLFFSNFLLSLLVVFVGVLGAVLVLFVFLKLGDPYPFLFVHELLAVLYLEE